MSPTGSVGTTHPRKGRDNNPIDGIKGSSLEYFNDRATIFYVFMLYL